MRLAILLSEAVDRTRLDEDGFAETDAPSVLRAIDGFADAVARLRRMIESEEPQALEAELDRTRTARRRLKERRWAPHSPAVEPS